MGSRHLGDAPDVASMLRELRNDSLPLTLPGIAALGFVLIGLSHLFADPFRIASCGLTLVVLAIAVFAASRVSYRLAAALLVLGSAAIVALLALWVGITPAIALLVVPSALATILGGTLAGIATASLSTGLLLWPDGAAAGIPAETALVTAVACWMTVGMVVLASRPLLTAIDWSWTSYASSRHLLSEARDAQVRLKEALSALAEANSQLTALNRLTQALRESAEEARRVKERFVANVSHELRTPLNMILGFVELIVTSPNAYQRRLPAALLSDLGVILRNSQHLSSLIDDILDLSRVESGRWALTKERVAVSEIVEAATAAVQPLFHTKHLYLTTDIAPDLPPVLLDRTRIREVLLNLLSNAARATTVGGVHVGVRRVEGDVVFSVADTGSGISPEDQDRLFIPFAQLEGSTRQPHAGSGLGISISKGFVELHGGRMWLESQVGVGSTFYFRLPIDGPTRIDPGVSRWFSPYLQYEERERTALPPQQRMQPRVVVLERDNALQRLVRRHLGEVNAVAVRTWEQAAEELARVPAQALLVNDHAIEQALPRLVGSSILPYGTPAVVCSLPGTLEAAQRLGIAGYLVKPVERAQLLSALEQLRLPGNLVLVVDDEEDELRLFQRMLTSAEPAYRVLRAGDGRTALHVLAQQRPDVILLDLVMPDVDGYRVLEAIHQDERLRTIPVLVISARDPLSEPIQSGAMALARGGGISAVQMLEVISALMRVVGAPGQHGDPVPPAAPTG